MWNDAAVTNGGQTLLNQWGAGETLVIDGARAGAGTVDVSLLASQTAVTDEKATLSVLNAKAVENGTQYQVQIKAEDSAYTAKQIGIYAHIGSGSTTMIALYQDEGGISVPSKSDMPDFVYAFYATIMCDNTGEMTITIDTSAVVSQGTLNETLKGYAEKDHTHALGGNSLTGSLPIAKGGTGATDAAAARTNLSAAAADHTHALNGDTVTGTLPIAKGGTGATSKEVARSNLDAASTEHTHALSGTTITGSLPVSKGGTGATDAAAARTNLSAAAADHTHALTGNTVTGVLPIRKGGTGAATPAEALAMLGIIYSEDEPVYQAGAIWLKPV